MLTLALQDISKVPFSLRDFVQCELSVVRLCSQLDVYALPEL